MTYYTARNGSIYGPYTEEQMRQHAATGYLLPTDSARADAAHAWQPLQQLLPELFAAPVAAQEFPSPPNLPWWLAALLDVVTGTVFFVVWDIIEAAWLRKVEPRSHALLLYSIAGVLFVLSAPADFHTVMHVFFSAPAVDSPDAGLFSLCALLCRFVARFSMRRSLLRHFNQVEPLGLHLSKWMTLFFGGLYFQFHFNRLNAMKRALAALPRA